jgi:GAF domain-containing protein
MADFGLKGIVTRLSQNLSRDNLVQNSTDWLRNSLNCDRVVLYYFYAKWEGQVTFESLSNNEYSIFGSQGPDECFNQEYANLYEANRISCIADVETAEIAECHRVFLRNLQVKANLVAPILTDRGLWGLLIAHHCQNTHSWSQAEINRIKEEANRIAQAESIR